MRILHTADWHLGKRLDRFYRLEEQREVLAEIRHLADEHEADVILIAGDLFDQYTPPNDATELFYKTLQGLSKGGQRLVVAIAGNHDSPERIQAPDPLARASGIVLCGLPQTEIQVLHLDNGTRTTQTAPGFAEFRLAGFDYPLRLLLTPYANEYRLRTYLGLQDSEEQMRTLLRDHWAALAAAHCDATGVNVLMTHLFMIARGEPVPEEPEGEKPILHIGGAQPVFAEDIPPQIQYTALGHLHRNQQIKSSQGACWYSSSPLAYSFAEADQQKYIMLADIAPGEPAQVTRIPLKTGKRLLRYKAAGVEEALTWLQAHTNSWVELTLQTDTYLRSEEKAQLLQAHQGIVSIIPELSTSAADGAQSQAKNRADLRKSMEGLFEDYFRYKHQGQEPNARIMDLFKEIRATTTGEEATA